MTCSKNTFKNMGFRNSLNMHDFIDNITVENCFFRIVKANLTGIAKCVIIMSV